MPNTPPPSQSVVPTPGPLVIRITKHFRFEAAHRFDHEDADHPFSRLHGHSFEGTVTVCGPATDDGGFVHDLWDLQSVIKECTADFDHAFLNDIADLPTPSLENMALTIFRRLDRQLDGLETVEIRRPSCGESASVTRP